MDLLNLGQFLVRSGLIARAQLERAVELQVQSGGLVIDYLTRLGFISEEKLTSFLAEKFSFPELKEGALSVPEELLSAIPAHLVLRYQILPVKLSNSTLTLAMVDPLNLSAINEVKFITGYEVKLAVARPSVLKKVINKYYENELNYQRLFTRVKGDDIQVVKEEEEISVQNLEKSTTEPPVVSLVNTLLADAIKKGASDIHIEPQKNHLRVRFRIDGMLYETVRPPLSLRDGLVSRIKVMASMDIAERRTPQDGRVRLRILNKEVDLRVSTLPTAFGECVVIRVLDRSATVLDPELLGFSSKPSLVYNELISRPHGMILVTGPTGSGKTTTLYASLNKINTPEKNIITIEDPVEYELAGINQIQVKPQAGLTFARGLRAIVRQDPDVIMVGEVRDAETAEIAIQSALTGHLVFSTLHTNDAAGAVSRLMEMGIEGFLLNSSLLCILAQRLVRRPCTACAELRKLDEKFASEIGVSLGDHSRAVIYSPVGCDECNNTGYRGRIGVYELLRITDKIRGRISEKADSKVIKEAAISEGMVTLRQDALEKAMVGLTTMEEILRVTIEDDS